MQRDIEGLLAGYGFAVPPVLLPQSNLLIGRAGPSAYELFIPWFLLFYRNCVSNPENGALKMEFDYFSFDLLTVCCYEQSRGSL